MPLIKASPETLHKIHSKVSDAYARNMRTGIEYEVQIDPPILRPIGNEMIYATHVLALNDQDWIEGDFFKVRWKQNPGKISSAREVKFIVPQQDGMPWNLLIVLGTIDV